MHQQIKDSLLSHADAKHSAFVSKLIPTSDLPILGVRMGQLRQLAKQVAKGDWRSYHQHAPVPATMEELMVQALSLGYLSPNVEIEEHLTYLTSLVPQLNNWSLIDSSVCTYKFVQCHRERIWIWLQDYLQSDQEYLARFGVVMLLFHFVKEEEYAAKIAAILPKVVSGPYYTDMAIAWSLCELYVHHQSIASNLLKEGTLPITTQKMARQKIRDSFRCSLDLT